MTSYLIDMFFISFCLVSWLVFITIVFFGVLWFIWYLIEFKIKKVGK